MNSIGNTLSNSAMLNTAEAQKELMKQYLDKRKTQCLLAEKLELSKRAINAGTSARAMIDKTVAELEQALDKYLAEHLDEIINNKYELLHISELEAKAELPGYRTGKIIAEIQHVLIFKRV